MIKQKLKNIITAFTEDRVTFFSVLIFGFAAHMFMLANKIPVDDDICNFYNKGATTVSGRYGLELIRLVMPDVSMPWIYGVMTLVLLAVAMCIVVRLFNIRSRLMQITLAGLFVVFPAQTGTMSYMFTSAPYALSLLMAVAAVYVFERRLRLRWTISPILLIFSCSIYQGYFAFAASFCVLLMIKALLDGESADRVFFSGIKMLAMLVLSVGIYGASVIIAGKLAGVSVLDVANKDQGMLMRIAVAYSAYLHTIFSGYFAYVNSSVSRLMHLVIIAVTGIGIISIMLKTKDIKCYALLALCLFLLPLSCYCLYMLADNGYIHSLALYPFASLYVLFAVVVEQHMDTKLNILRWVSLAAAVPIIIGNIYFANSFYLYSALQYESRSSFYTSMMTQVVQNEGFDADSRLAIIGEQAALDYDLTGDFSFARFQLPGNNIMKPIHAKDIINNYLGFDIPFADEVECAALAETPEVEDMAVYPYYGSVEKIGDCIVVKLG